MIDLLTSEEYRVVWRLDLPKKTRQRQRHTYKDTQDMKLEFVNLGAKVWKKQRRLSAERLSTH